MPNLNELVQEYLELEDFLIDKYRYERSFDRRHVYAPILFTILGEISKLKENIEQVKYKEFVCPIGSRKVNDIKNTESLDANLKKYLELQQHITKIVQEGKVYYDGINRRNVQEGQILFEILREINKLGEVLKRNANVNIKEFNCPYRTSKEDTDKMNLMLKPNSNLGKNKLEEFVKGVKKLIIIDPYIFTERENEIFTSGNKSLQSLEDIRIIYDKTKENGELFKKEFQANIIKSVGKPRCNVESHSTNKIHDRIWIADGKKGLAVGTSLNSVGGKKVSFILELPHEDLENIIEFLKVEKLVY